MAERKEFLALIGHEADHDEEPSEEAKAAFAESDPAVIEALAAAFLRRMASAAEQKRTTCGWWWCEGPEHERWPELLCALKLLRERGIDPWDIRIATLGELLRGVDKARASRRKMDALLSALEGVDLADDPNARHFRDKWIAEAAVWHEQTKRAHPSIGRRGGASNTTDQEVLALAAQWGWDAEAAAAAIFLVGADRASLESIRRRLKEASRRHKIRAHEYQN